MGTNGPTGLCTSCQRVELRPEILQLSHSSSYPSYVLGTYQDIIDRPNCALCRLCVRAIYEITPLEYAGEQVVFNISRSSPVSLCWHPGKGYALSIADCTKYITFLREYDHQHEDDSATEEDITYAVQREDTTLPAKRARLPRSYGDLDQIKDWLRRCRDHHGEPCNGHRHEAKRWFHKNNSTIFKESAPRLIDVNSLSIVDASSIPEVMNNEFAALSYVGEKYLHLDSSERI